MKWIFNQIKQEPVMFQMVIQTLLPLLVAFGVVTLSEQRLGAIYAFAAALLSFVARTQVTPLANPRDNAGNSLTPGKK